MFHWNPLKQLPITIGAQSDNSEHFYRPNLLFLVAWVYWPRKKSMWCKQLVSYSTLKTKSKSVRIGHFLFSPSSQAFLLAFLLAQKNVFWWSWDLVWSFYTQNRVKICHFLFSPSPQAFLLAFLLGQKNVFWGSWDLVWSFYTQNQVKICKNRPFSVFS